MSLLGGHRSKPRTSGQVDTKQVDTLTRLDYRTPH